MGRRKSMIIRIGTENTEKPSTNLIPPNLKKLKKRGIDRYILNQANNYTAVLKPASCGRHFHQGQKQSKGAHALSLIPHCTGGLRTGK